MDRRAFLLGALAAPIAAPAIAKAAAPATGGVVRSISPYVIGEVGPEMIIPRGYLEVISQATGIPQRMLVGEARNVRLFAGDVQADVEIYDRAIASTISEGRSVEFSVGLSSEVDPQPEV